MNRLLTILLLLAATAHGQIANPPTSVNIVDSTATGRAVLTATNAAAAATAVGLGTTNSVTFSNITASGNIYAKDSTASPATNSSLARGIQWTNLAGFHAAIYGNYVGTPQLVIAAGASNSFSDVATFRATGMTVNSNAIVGGTLAVSNTATFSTNVTVNGNISVGSLTTTTPSTWALDATQTAAATNGRLTLPSNANVIRLTNNNAISSVTNGVLGAFYYLVNQATNAVTISNVGGITIDGAQNLTLSPNESATLVATGATNASVANRGDLNNVTLTGVDNLATQQTASSASSLMTRELSDVRYSPMPMTPQIIPWFYNGSLSVTRVTNGLATFGTSAAYPTISLTTNAADSGVMILVDQVWGAVDGAANPWNAVGKSVIIQGRLASTASNAVSRFVWSSSTNWPTIMTNLGTNGISNLGWAVETRNSGGSNEARLIVNGSTNKSESAWTVIGYNPGNDSSFMVVPRVGSTSLYWAQESSTFSRTPLITVTNQIGGSVAAAYTGGLGFAVINTNTPAGSSSAYIRRCYQVLGMTNYGY